MSEQIQKPDYQARVVAIAAIVGMIFQGLYSFFVPVVVPSVPVEKWYVTRDGEVVDAPAIIAVADALEDGSYALVGYPRAGKITQRSVVVGDGTPAPIPVPPKPVDPPAPIPPQPETLQGKITQAATGIPASEREAVAAVYSQVSDWIERKQIQSTHLACVTLIAELKKLSLSSLKWEGVWALIRENPVETLEDSRTLYVRVANGLRGAK